MAAGLVSTTNRGVPNVEIPAITGAADTDATAGAREANDLSGKSTIEMLDDLAAEIEVDTDLTAADDDSTPAGEPAKPIAPAAAETTESLPPAGEQPAGDATGKAAGEVAEVDEELVTELRALEQLNNLPANSLDGFSTVKDAERSLALFYARLEQLQQPPQQQFAQPQQVAQPIPPTQPGPKPALPEALKIDLESMEPDDPIRIAIEAQQKVLNDLLASQQQTIQQQTAQQQANEQREIHRQVSEFNTVVDKLDNGVFGIVSKGLSPSQQLMRRSLGQKVASIGLAMAQGGQAVDYDTLLPMAMAAPEFKVPLAKQQLLSQNGNGNGKQRGAGKKLGTPGRGTSAKDFKGSAALAYNGPVEDNPELLEYANQRLADG